MKTPRTGFVLWFASNIGLLAIAPLYAVWLTRVLHQEAATAGPVYAPTGDTPAIPIAGVMALVLCALPFLNLALYWILRRYPGRVDLAQKPKFYGRRTSVEIFYAIVLVALAFVVVDSFRFRDWEFTGLSFYWVALVMNLRAISLAKADQIQRR